MEPTSEQELKELLDEGKISEKEYQELLEALHQKQTVQPQPPFRQPEQSKTPEKFGKAAFFLMIVSFGLPLLGIGLSLLFYCTGIRLSAIFIIPALLFGLLCGIFAFIFGIIGWKSASGKIAVIGVPCLGILTVPVLLFMFFFNVRYQHQVAMKEALAGEQAAIEEVRARHLESLQAYPMDSLEGLISQGMAVIDEDTFFNGGGSLRIKSDSPEKQTIRLYETGPMGIEDTMLIYSAELKSQLQQGQAYLEMWCDIPGKGKFFSRGLEHPVTGITEWTNVQTPFHLEVGQMPANVKLNLVIEGIGTVWIDDIKLLLSPLD